MPISYTNADESTIKRVNQILLKYHGELVDAKVTFSVQMAAAAQNEDGEGTDADPVTVNGYNRAAKVKIFSLADRAEKMPDFRITLDEKIWNDASATEKDAIIDGQLERLELKKDSENAVKIDDQGRPVLKLKKWDHCFQWFDAVADRHKGASVEVQEAKHFFDEHGQGWLGPTLWDSPDGGKTPTAAEALNTLTGGNGEPAEHHEKPELTTKPKGRGKRSKKPEFVDAKDGAPVKQGVRLPDAGAEGVAAAAPATESGEKTAGEKWAEVQRPAMVN